MSLLGLDVGTSGCKAVLFHSDGEPIASAYEEYDACRPEPGWAELEVAEVWTKIQRVIRQVTQQSTADPVKALAVSSLGEAVVPVTYKTYKRQILGRSILHFDRRGQEYLPDLEQRLGSERLYAINGNPLGPNYSLTKLMWIKEHQPELYNSADCFLHWSGFVSFMLGAEPAVDYSLANRTLLFDLEHEDWSDELLKISGLDRTRLPRPVPSGTVIGRVLPRLAQKLGIAPNALIVAGAHDQCANALGCGVIEEGQALYGMGTFLCMVPVFSQRPEERRSKTPVMLRQGLNTEHHAVPGLYASFIYNQGGSLLKWYRDTFAAVERDQAKKSGEDIYHKLIAEMPSTPGGVIVLPYFPITGPPHFLADSSGVIAGLHLETKRGDILKGILEGATFYLRECLENLPEAGINISTLRAAGGGSKSYAWMQLTADILGKPLTCLKTSEAGAQGCAILAGIAAGEFSSYAEGCQVMVKTSRTFEPDSQQRALYQPWYEKYTRLFPLLRDYLKTL